MTEVVKYPRSSNLAIKKTFTDLDRDQFLAEAFEYIRNYFANSLTELGHRNSDLFSDVQEIEGAELRVSLYRNGELKSFGVLFKSSSMGKTIGWSTDQNFSGNSFNDQLTVEADDQRLYLKSFMNLSPTQGKNAKLTFEGAAEYLWAKLIAPMQGGWS